MSLSWIPQISSDPTLTLLALLVLSLLSIFICGINKFVSLNGLNSLRVELSVFYLMIVSPTLS